MLQESTLVQGISELQDMLSARYLSRDLTLALRQIELALGADTLYLDDKAVLKEAVTIVRSGLCPEPCSGIKADFWATNAGQVLANAEWLAFGEDAISIADAARILHDSAETRHIVSIKRMIERGELTTIHRPFKNMPHRRTETTTDNVSPRSVFVLRSEIEAHKARRG